MRAKGRKALLGAAIIVALALGVGAARIAAYRPAAAATDAGRAGVEAGLGHVWRGAIHVHTTLSDGAGSIAEVAEAAAADGLDFVIVTDHNPIGSGRPSTAWHGNVLVVIAEEISTQEGHLLAFGVRPHRYRFGPTARQALADIADEGGWAAVAHPDHAGEPWSGGWGGTVGVEVVNLAATWSRRSTTGRAAAVASLPIDADYAALRLLGDDWPALGLWDALVSLPVRPVLAPRPRVALGAADAHGPIVSPFPLPGYAETLAAVDDLVWLDIPPGSGGGVAADVAEGALLAALRAGRVAVETAAIGDGRGFVFTARASGSTTARIGDVAAWEAGPWDLSVGLASPAAVRIVLLRNGEVVAEAAGGSLRAVASEPGSYRAEVYRTDLPAVLGGSRPTPWLVGNPIYLWPAPARYAARVRRAPPLPAPPVSEELLAAARFRANGASVLDNSVRADPDGSFSWRFRLDPESPREAFAAMAWWPEGRLDWSAADGLVVWLQAESTLRVVLELRTLAPDGTSRSWFHSLKAGPDGDATAIPWSWFRPPWPEDPALGAQGGGGDGDERSPDAAALGAVQGLFFVVTPTSLAPGSEASLRLRGLGLYGAR